MDVIGVWQAYDFVQEKLFGAESSTEITETLAAIPVDKLSLLEGHRVLTGDKVNLRTEPSEQSEIKALPQKGALLEVLEEGEVWIRVSVDVAGETLEGWIARRYTIPIRIPAKK
nr:SH3 domain-containing protein [Pseudomonas putida]